MSGQDSHTPWWFTVMTLAVAAVALVLPFTGTSAPSGGEWSFLLKLYPLYVLASGVLAWMCYPRRRAMAWILLILLLLSHGAVWMLLNP